VTLAASKGHSWLIFGLEAKRSLPRNSPSLRFDQILQVCKIFRLATIRPKMPLASVCSPMPHFLRAIIRLQISAWCTLKKSERCQEHHVVIQIDENLWIFDGPEVRFMSLDLPTRMTIAHVDSGLWVHSPIPITRDIKNFVSTHGSVSQVVAPNNLHHLYMDDWFAEYPDADFVAAPGLREKRADLAFTSDLKPGESYTWSDAIDHAHFVGNRFFEEAVFFHKVSKTLILTDLILNLKTEGFSAWQRAFARFDGVAYPDGMSPRFFRWSMRNRKAAQTCYEQMIAWAPEKIVISHGECMLENGTNEVRKRLGWVLSD